MYPTFAGGSQDADSNARYVNVPPGAVYCRRPTRPGLRKSRRTIRERGGGTTEIVRGTMRAFSGSRPVRYTTAAPRAGVRSRTERIGKSRTTQIPPRIDARWVAYSNVIPRIGSGNRPTKTMRPSRTE